jgi:hypothetical protein
MKLQNSFIIVFLLWSFGFAASAAPKGKDANAPDPNHPEVFGPIYNLIPRDLADQILPTAKKWNLTNPDMTEANKLAADIKKAIVGKTVMVPCITIDIRKQAANLYYVKIESTGKSPGMVFWLAGTLRISEAEIKKWIELSQGKATITATFTDKVDVRFKPLKDAKTGRLFLGFYLSQSGNNWEELKFSLTKQPSPAAPR